MPIETAFLHESADAAATFAGRATADATIASAATAAAVAIKPTLLTILSSLLWVTHDKTPRSPAGWAQRRIGWPMLAAFGRFTQVLWPPRGGQPSRESRRSSALSAFASSSTTASC